MIKNIIFDMGGVLLDFNPKASLSKYFSDEADIELLLKELFNGPDWVRLDKGTLTIDEAIERTCSRIPERLHAKLSYLLKNWKDEMPPKENMYPLVEELKTRGYGIYLLSNVPHNFNTYRCNIPGNEFFDGFLISSDHHVLKPEPRLYEILYETFSLKPEECFFIDDVKANIEGAAATGMGGYCYDHGDVNILREALMDEGIL